MTNDLNKAVLTSPLDEKGHDASTQALLDAFPMADKIAAMYAEVAIRAYLSTAPALAVSQPIGDGMDKSPGRCWPLGGYAPGNYTCTCVSCGKLHEADKRASQCLVCAVSDAQALIAAKDAMIEELEAMIRANGTPRFNAALDRAETAEAQVKRLTEDNEALRVAVATPEAVHANMLRGGIPKLSIRQALHLHGAEALEKWGGIETSEARIKALEEALRRIAEGNLGDDPWQANYAKIRTVARQALSGSEKDAGDLNAPS